MKLGLVLGGRAGQDVAPALKDKPQEGECGRAALQDVERPALCGVPGRRAQ